MEETLQFMKNLKVLFVEDEDMAREKLGKFLKKRFGEVVVCDNGLDGFFSFENAYTNKKFDLIISDINMPKIDGLELLEKIRTKDRNTPFVFLTARTESEHMLKSIKYRVYDYILKPIDFTLFDEKILEISKELFYKRNYELQKKELQHYIDMINQETIVTKTDLRGIIIFVNDAFCQLSGYSKEELIGQPHNIIRHPDTPKSLYEELWSLIKSGNEWNGTLKNIDKFGNVFYNKSKIMPIFDEIIKDKIVGYMGIRFSNSDEEISKKEFRKKVRENVQESRKKEFSLNQRIKELETLLTTTNVQNHSFFLHNQVDILNKKLLRTSTQVKDYEKKIKEIESEKNEIIKNANEKVKTYSESALSANRKMKDLNSVVISINKQKETQLNTIRKLQESLDEKIDNIKDLTKTIEIYKSRFGIRD